MQITRSITFAIRAVSATALLLALSACGGDNAAPAAAEPPVKQATALLPGLEAAKTSAQSPQPKATLPSFTGHGWWWNPAEPGTGFAFEVQGTQAFVAFFMYDQFTGSPVWYASFGTFNGTTFTGNLQSFKNGMPVAATVFKPAALDATQGPVTIVFSSATNGRVTFPGGRTQVVERYNFVAPVAGEPTPVRTNKPEAGWWWNQDEPGRGYAIERQGNDIFLAAFHYTAGGANTWNIVNGKLDTNTNLYGASLKSVLGGQSLTSTWRPATFGADAGKVDITFSSPCEAIMRLPAGNYVNLRKYNFGGDDARCRADIVAAAAPSLPLLAQCFAVRPGVFTSVTDVSSVAFATAPAGAGFYYYDTFRSDQSYSSASFQGRSLVQRLITNNNLTIVAAPTLSSRLHEFTPTAWASIVPGTRTINGASVPYNAGVSYTEDATLPVGGTWRRTTPIGFFSNTGEPITDNYSATFVGLETVMVGQRSLPNSCRIDYLNVIDTNAAGTLVSTLTRSISGSIWYAPGYGYVKGSYTVTSYDGRIPSSYRRTITPTFVSP
jgi:hypothetical protein